MIDKNTANWKNLPFWLKCCFSLNLLITQPTRSTAKRVEMLSHISGFLFCILGLVNQAALAGGLIMLTNADLFYLLIWQGDKYGIWYQSPEAKNT